MFWAKAICADDFAELMIKVFSGKGRCVLMREWCYRLLTLPMQLFEVAFAEGHSWPAEVASASALRGRCRRMRLDPHLGHLKLQRLVASRRIRSAAQAARSGQVDVAVSSARESEEEEMKRYMYAPHETFKDCAQLAIATDESVVGGERTMLGALYCHRKRLATWVVPQATCVFPA